VGGGEKRRMERKQMMKKKMKVGRRIRIKIRIAL
jgi:hypothetical protein